MSQPLWSSGVLYNQTGLVWASKTITKGTKMSAHVSLSYKKKKDPAIIPFAQGVHDGLAANATLFNNLPVTLVALLAAIADFTAKYNASRKGSQAQIEAKDASRIALEDLLNQLAAYVEGKAQGNADTIRLAGFEPVTHAYSPSVAPAKPDKFGVVNAAAGKVQIKPTMQPNIHSVQVEYRTNNGTWTSAGGFTDSRKIFVTNLTPGTLFDFHIAFVGGGNTTSEWSDLVTHMVA
jgi:hypothetical protein